MNFMKYSKYILPTLLLFGLNASAGLMFNYSQLALKDLDQMNALVVSAIKDSKKTAHGKTVPLKETLQAVYSRPNDDGMVEKVIGPLRSELDELDSWEKVLNSLTVEAVDALKHPKAFKPVVQVTYQVFLENLLADMKPYLSKPGFERSLAEKIRDAKIEITKEASSERALRTMKSAVSPSEVASELLSAAPEKADETKEEPAAAH